MKSIPVRLVRFPSIMLAAALQLLPIVRAALPAAQNAGSVIVILFRWAAAGAAALGGIQAVSGASTVITNPLTAGATNGQPFSLRLTTAPDQAHYWTASGLPLGILLSGTGGSTYWLLTGTPTVAGTFPVALTAKDQSTSGAVLQGLTQGGGYFLGTNRIGSVTVQP
jgi:putative Ig domain-containing protein